jgi:hypothetical protein
MEASLVNATDEQELINILDELDTPTACTWSEYDGPLWIDVDLNLKVRVKGPFEKASAATVAIGDTKPLLNRLLKFSAPSTGTAEAMRDEIMQRVFPSTHAAFEKALDRAAKQDRDDALPPSNALKAAIARDLLDHEKALLGKGVDLDESGGLLPTRTLYFVRRGSGHFDLLEAPAVHEFLFGERAIRPETDGLVRIALVTVTLARDAEGGYPAEISGLKFRTSTKGKIVSANRADAFDEHAGQEAQLFELRRNRTVRWELAREDELRLLTAIKRLSS